MDLKQAKQMIDKEKLTCMIFLEDVVYISRERGVKPLLKLIDEKKSYPGFSAVDKVVGKAVAFLYVILGIQRLHACIISEAALEVLKKHKIDVTYDTLVKYIINRAGDGRCPMESAVMHTEDSEEALRMIRSKLEELSAKGDRG